jgi:hypothetical protein
VRSAAIRSSALARTLIANPLARPRDLRAATDLEVRLNHLVTAVKMVYASAYVEQPRRYLDAIGHR